MTKYLTVEQAAQHLGVEYKTVYRLVRSGEIPAGRVGRIYRIREDDVDAYFERQKLRLAAQTGGRGLAPVEGLRCGACGSPILGELSIGGTCDVCDRDICLACWAVRKARHCHEHARNASEETSGARNQGPPAPAFSGQEDGVAEAVERLRAEGQPVVTAEEAKLAEETYLRSFAQRLESIEELPDPLSGRTIVLRNARVTHVMDSKTGRGRPVPANMVSRFTLDSGGWGKPKAGLVVEARFASRSDVLASQGYDAVPAGEAGLSSILNELREFVKIENRFHVVLVASPTGWSQPAIDLVAVPDYGRAFRDQHVGVALYDSLADQAHLDEADKRLWAFWPLLAPAKYAREVQRCVGRVEELAAQYSLLTLRHAGSECGGDRSWVREAFRKLKETGEFEVREGSGGELILSRPLQ